MVSESYDYVIAMLGTQIQSSTCVWSAYRVPGIALHRHKEDDKKTGQVPLKLVWVVTLVSPPLGMCSFLTICKC